jgi:hypothetical protein
MSVLALRDWRPSVGALLASLLLAPSLLARPQADPTPVVPHGPVLRVTPSATEYVAHGTLPLPDGWTFTEACPFGLRRQGLVYPCQWSPVAYTSSGQLAVVELAAVVPGVPGGAAAGPVTYEVVQSSGAPYPYVPTWAPAGTLLTAGLAGQVWLRVLDSHGNVYAGLVSQPFEWDTSTVEYSGRARGVYATRGRLFKLSGAPNALPYLGGFHAWFTVHAKDSTLELDLQWHNATVGPVAEMAGDILFEKVELILPSGWRSLSKWPLPTAGSTYETNLIGAQRTVVELIRDVSTPHVLRQRGRLTWRTVLHPKNDGTQATKRKEQVGFGVVRGETRGWQDAQCARWLAQQTLLPDLTHWQKSFAAELTQQRQDIETALTQGTPYLYNGVGQMGPYHSYGSSYGGMTGGSEIDQTPGAPLMWTGSTDGLLATQMLHRMVLDRQYGWFFDTKGELLLADDLEDPAGKLPVDIYSNDFINLNYVGALGFELVPDTYGGVSPRPPYEDALIGTTPFNGLEQHDAQHGVRATWPLKVLVWAANDRMARHDLIAQAALWQMEFHDGPDGRLSDMQQWAQAHPHVAGEFGRGEAWSVDGVAHWYALLAPGQREFLEPWFQKVVSTLETLQSPLDVFYGNRYGKITEYYAFNKQFAIVQWYEHAILQHAIACLLESWAPTPALRTKLERFLVEGTLAIWKVGWKPGTDGSYDQQAVAPIDPALPAYSSVSQIPATGVGGGPTNDQFAGPLAYALQYATASEYQELWAMAQALTKNSDPLTGLLSLYPYYLAIGNRAPLLAWLQELDG